MALVPLMIALRPGFLGGAGFRVLGAGRAVPGAGCAVPRGWCARAFLLGLVTGVVHFAGTLYWITGVMTSYGGLSALTAVAVNALLVAYLALFVGLFALGVAWGCARLGRMAIALVPAWWVVTELGRTHIMGGFPWVLLGYSQLPVGPVAQLASLLGVYGVSALLVAAATAAACAIAARGRLRISAPVCALGVTVAVAVWGDWRMRSDTLTRAGAPLRVGLVQGNIAQAEKEARDVPNRRRIFDTYLRMTREATGRGAQFVLWPETAAPFPFEQDTRAADEVRAIARHTGAHVLVGSDQEIAGRPLRLYNAAFLVAPNGRTTGVYQKVRLVPFGEYVPLRNMLFFAARLVEGVSDFSPGAGVVTLPLGARPISTAICYEVVYPELIREAVDRGSVLLTTITNDAWFGRSSAPYQHFDQAAMRAIEQGRYLVRAANTGISGIVDPYGRVTARSRLFEPAVITGDVRLLEARTFYGRIGFWFGPLCLAACAAAALAGFVARTPEP